jgi:Domain of unknown function(DUF2779)
MKKITVSKSSYIEGLRCPKLFWLRVNRPELAMPVDAQTEYLFATGHLVGELARKLFPAGALIGGKEFKPFDRLLTDTQVAIESGMPCLFEAAFESDSLRCRPDVLHRSKGSTWDLAEVKMCTAVKPAHIHDIAFQAHCIKRSGQEVGRKFLIHVSRDYVKSDIVNPHELFVAVDLTEAVNAESGNVPVKVKGLIELAEQQEQPSTILGTKCKSPGACPFYEYCHKDLPPTSVYQLPYGGKLIPMLLGRGIFCLADIPPDVPLSKRQGALVQSARKGKPIIEVGAIRTFLKQIRFPVHFLDFETSACCIPPWDKTFAYEKIPFQFSVHVQDAIDGAIRHNEFLPESPEDPRRQLCDELVEILHGSRGTVLAWNASFEKGVLERMAVLFPDLSAKIHAVIARIIDLILPFRNADYVDFRFEGSCSLKKVAPAMVSALSYDSLSIKHGDEASLQFQMFVDGKMSAAQWMSIRQEMLDYCKLDTLAMVEILAKLFLIVKGGLK